MPRHGILFSTKNMSYQVMKRLGRSLNAYDQVKERLHIALQHPERSRTMETIKRLRVARSEEEQINRQSTEDFEGTENIRYEIIMDICHYIFVIFVQPDRIYNTKSEP